MDDQSDNILRITTVLKRTGLTRSTLYRKIADGSFPKNVAISARCVGWRESAVRRWMMNPMFYSVDDDQGQQRSAPITSIPPSR